MSSSRRHFERFKAHTRLKHAILDTYVKRWAPKLLLSKLAGKEVWFVDAFAGAGHDDEGNPGSPLIVGELVRKIASGEIAPLAAQGFRLHLLALEASEPRYKRLTAALRATVGIVPDIHVRNVTLGAIVDRLVEHVGAAPLLTFLDPFGLRGIEQSHLPKLLGGARNEVLALFSDQGVVRLLGLASTSVPDFNRKRVQARITASVFGDEHTAELQEELEAGIRRSEQGYQGRERAAEILTAAFGNTWRTDLAGLPTAQIPGRAVSLFEQQLRLAGAQWVTNYSVCDSRGRHQYYLVHATKSRVGRRAMKESIAEAEKRLNLRQQGFVFDADIRWAVQETIARFAGREVRFSTPAQRGDPVIRDFLLEETELIYPDHIEAVQQELDARGLRTAARAVTYAFPSID